MRFKQAAVLIATLSAIAAAAPADAAIPTGNLVKNPGAEDAPGGVSSETAPPRCPPMWGCTSSFTGVRYGTTTFPSSAESARIDGGTTFFAGGPNQQSSMASQSLDISAALPEISASGVQATVSACLGGFAGDGDKATLKVYFGNESAGAPGGTFFTVGPSTVADRGGKTGFVRYSATMPIRSDVKSAFAFLEMERSAGAYNDGYADNVSVRLGPYPGPAPPSVTCRAPDAPAAPGGRGGGGTTPTGVTRLLGFARVAKVDRGGNVTFRMRCATRQVDACSGKLTLGLVRASKKRAQRSLAARTRVLGRSSFSIESLERDVVVARLSARGRRSIARLSRRALKRRRLQVSTVTRVGSERVRQTGLLKIKRVR